MSVAAPAVTDLLDLTGKVALVTGASGGIGRGITRRSRCVLRGGAARRAGCAVRVGRGAPLPTRSGRPLGEVPRGVEGLGRARVIRMVIPEDDQGRFGAGHRIPDDRPQLVGFASGRAWSHAKPFDRSGWVKRGC